MKTITWEEFEQVELRVGTVIEVEDFPEARKPAYKLKVDFGEFGIKRSSAQLTHLYSKDELKGRQVVGVINFPPKADCKFLFRSADYRLLSFDWRSGAGAAGEKSP
jgi:tRNA-binding protein